MAPSLSPLGFTSGHSICYCTFPILAEKSQASALMTEVQGGAVQGSQTPPRLPRPLLHYHLPSALLWRMLVSLLNKDAVQQSSWHLRPQVSAKALQCTLGPGTAQGLLPSEALWDLLLFLVLPSED